jgi:curved DNA-binding protein
MQNHYKTLGLTNAASTAEIRRAYRVLARRYHPDVNPDGDNGDVFKAIAQAYSVLSDPERRKQYDVDLKQSSESLEEAFERARDALRRNQQAAAYARQQQAASTEPRQSPQNKTTTPPPKSPPKAAPNAAPARPPSPSALQQLSVAPKRALNSLRKAVAFARTKALSRVAPTLKQLSVVEVSVSIADAIHGAKRTVEIEDGSRSRKKVSVSIPPGVRTGSTIRLRSKERVDAEIVLIIKVESHPWLSLGDRGLTMEIPLTIAESIEGAKIQVPSLGDPLLVTVEPLTQSGKEVRLKGQGITNRDGSRGDLYVRFVVKIPSQPLPEEIRSLTELTAELYTVPVRQHLPTRLFQE